MRRRKGTGEVERKRAERTPPPARQNFWCSASCSDVASETSRMPLTTHIRNRTEKMSGCSFMGSDNMAVPFRQRTAKSGRRKAGSVAPTRSRPWRRCCYTTPWVVCGSRHYYDRGAERPVPLEGEQAKGGVRHGRGDVMCVCALGDGAAS